ncbi:recombination regulator RecX [Rhizobacter sp. AJA081-3]|uniref:recombination regulator RecX n=1 Tax=Rhizobacter sp. AJA081-3 TaxID=2753607 RepID=UPI001AE0D31A|nr:recombination regulator RecX [Rhizobacter sp. AJA081-3]QTN22912.1 recombination regulator RecX [Rhizobacter sp. AJA081-3]
MKPATPRSLKARALQWLAQREHSRVEMQRKLLPHARAQAAQREADGDAADPMARVAEVLDWLEANRYLSQQRFVESRIHVRAARHGNLRIQQELAQHGLAPDADAAQSLKASELDRAREVWSRKFDAPAADASGRARQARFLTGRGFSAETVRRVLRESARGLHGDDTD